MENRTLVYIVSKPVTPRESFTFNEILALQRLGLNICIYSLRNKDRAGNAFENITQVINLFSFSVLKAHLYYCFSSPKGYWKHFFLTIKRLKDYYVFLKAVSFAFEIKNKNIFHLHSPWASQGAMASLIISRITGIPFSFKAHGWDLFCAGRMLKKKVRESAFVVAISDYNKRYLIDKFGVDCAQKIYVIHCGVNLSEFSYNVIDRKNKNILSIATFTEKKGTKYLLMAARLLKDSNDDFMLVVVGEWSDRREKKYKQMLEKYINKNSLQKHVLIIEKPDRQRIKDLIKGADLFVLPSLIAENGDRDGIPVALMEAMASGLPVITTNVSGIPELVIDKQTGILAKSCDSIDLAEKMKFLLSNEKLRSRLIENARKKIEMEFDVAKNSNLLKKLFLT